MWLYKFILLNMKLDLHFKTWVTKRFSEFAKKKNPLKDKFTFTCLNSF